MMIWTLGISCIFCGKTPGNTGMDKGGETMPNIKSTKKRVRVNAVKTAHNKAIRSDLRTAVKKADIALTNSAEDRTEVVRAAMKKIDCAVTKGILHKNCAARKKSNLQLKLNKAG